MLNVSIASKALWFVGLFALIASALQGCSGESDRPAWVSNLRGSDTSNTKFIPCTNNETRACGDLVDERFGVRTCFRGTRTCHGDTWGECIPSATLELSVTDRLSPWTKRTAALSSPTDCAGNPCDPECQIFDEEPKDPITATSTKSTYEWVTGSLGSLPGGLASKGFNEPCSVAMDCQFNTYCKSPSKGSCSHSLCTTGAALSDGCTDCTTAVCAAEPNCCVAATTTPTAVSTAACGHSPCVTGTGLTSTCNSCVGQICAKFPSCCGATGTWTSACAAEVASTCKMTCGCASGEVEYAGSCYVTTSSKKSWADTRTICTSKGSSWDLAQINTAAENTFVDTNLATSASVWIGFQKIASTTRWKWSIDPSSIYWVSGATTPYTNWNGSAFGSGTSGDCVLTKTDGTWIRNACTGSYSGICESNTHVLYQPAPVTGWTASCVAKVATHCGAVCDTKLPTATTGLCTPWYPGEERATCDGIDLSAGTPCDANLAVCNHGTKEAPSGIRIVHFPANSQQYPKCDPDLTKSNFEECFTKQPIPPGHCINVTDCPGMKGNREIMINPGGPTNVAECTCGDNWTLFSGGACVEPICAGGTSVAASVTKPIDIIFVIDNSGSLTEEIIEVQERINEDFAAIIGASGIDYRIIMFARYGDVLKAVGGSDHPICIRKPLGGNDCTNPSTEPLTLTSNFFHYSADVESWNSWCLLLGSYKLPDEVTDGSSTGRTGWVAKAPNGWSQWLRPNALKVFVEITDDDVECSWKGYSFDDNVTTAGGTTAAAQFDAAILALDPSQFGTASNRNYVWHSIVGLAAKTTPTAPWLPTEKLTTSKCSPGSEGPGTGYQALSVLTGGLRYPTCNYSDFNAVFNAIATQVIESSSASCEYALPTDKTTYDPQRVTINYLDSKGSGNPQPLTQVAALANCISDGWYFNDPTDPTSIKLCPTICSTVEADTAAKIVVEIGCPQTTAPVTVTDVFTATCDDSSGNIWMDLAYNATIVGDGNIVFRARVAATTAELATATWVALGTATTTKQVCPLGASCAFNVFELLGATLAQSPYLELEITVNPSTTGSSPILTDYQITYSCKANR